MMTCAAFPRWFLAILLIAMCCCQVGAADAAPDLAQQAQVLLRTHCHRCHGQEGSVEGGLNYILDRDRLIARKKIVPGQPDASPLLKKVEAGKMPPPGEQPRPSAADIALLRRWIETGALSATPVVQRAMVSEEAVLAIILADLEKLDRRARRFTRYFSAAPLANGGASADELRTYRNALGKLLNSLSWHQRITLPQPVDADGLVLRIDLRDFIWDATLWNRLLTEYPYGILQDSAVSRAVLVHTASRLPVVRLDWFVATASRAPLYYDLLQLPANLAELEKQLRVDVGENIRQERVARAGFLGSGISRNNRVLERHDALHGAYWRTYDFDAVPQNLVERDLLLPDRRNIFAYPLGPGFGDNGGFQHAGGEAIFNLPNGLQGYILVNAVNQRIDKGPTAIVSDPKRPDRAVEAGVSCMSCHASGILIKEDQLRDHIGRNPKLFARNEADLIRALYVPRDRMTALMKEDGARFQRALEKTGLKVGSVEVVMTLTLRHEADLDLPTLAAELGRRPEEVLPHLLQSEILARNLGALKVPGGTVARQVVVQSFADLVREMRLGTPFQPGLVGQTVADNTGEADPLESQSSPANAAVISRDGRVVALASNDKTIRFVDVATGRDIRRFIGHPASLWAVALSADGTRVLSGGKDGSVRLWDAETGREVRKLDGHADLVTAVALSPDGHRALSAGFDNELILWDLDQGEAIPTFVCRGVVRYVNRLVFDASGEHVLVCGFNGATLLDAKTGRVLRTFTHHQGPVLDAAFGPDGKSLLTGGDDHTARLVDVETGKEIRVYRGHEGAVRAVAFSADGKFLATGGADATVRFWDSGSDKELKVFRKHADGVIAVAFTDEGRKTLSVSRDAVVLPWIVLRPTTSTTTPDGPVVTGNLDTTRPPRRVGGVSVGGTVAGFLLSPDRKYLYYLNSTDARLARIDTATGKSDHVLALAAGTDTVGLSRDGQNLVAIAPAAGPGNAQGCIIQVIDPVKVELKKQFAIPVAAFDLAVGDAGRIYLSGAGSEWTDVTVVDTTTAAIVAQSGGVWSRSFLHLSPDNKRLVVASQGVTPGTLESIVFPNRMSDKPVTTKAAANGQYPHGGDFVMTPDGRFLLFKTGTVLRMATEPGADMQGHANLGPFAAAVVDPETKVALLLTSDGALKVYSYPEFRLLTSHRLNMLPTQAVLDVRAGKLYVAGMDPGSLAEQPRARGHGDVVIYDIAHWIRK